MKKIALSFLLLSGCAFTKVELLGYTIGQHISSLIMWGFMLWGCEKLLEKIMD